MENPVYVVALVLGAVMLLSVCFVYVKHQVLQVGGIVLSGFAVVLVGMSVWRSIDVSVDEEGFKAKLEQVIAVANEAKTQADQVKEITSKNYEAALSLKDAFEIFKAQDVLRDKGLYKGVLDGHFSAATKKSILDFQELNNIPKTGSLDSKTIKELEIKPIENFPQLERSSALPSAGMR